MKRYKFSRNATKSNFTRVARKTNVVNAGYYMPRGGIRF